MDVFFTWAVLISSCSLCSFLRLSLKGYQTYKICPSIVDDWAAQIFKKAVKLENAQLKPVTLQTAPKHSRAHSMSNALADFRNTDLPSASFQRSGTLKYINELQPMEGISWEGTTSAAMNSSQWKECHGKEAQEPGVRTYRGLVCGSTAHENSRM